jgi:hypothetical protein
MEAVLEMEDYLFATTVDETIFNALDNFNLEIPHELDLSEPIHSTVARQTGGRSFRRGKREWEDDLWRLFGSFDLYGGSRRFLRR